MSIKEKYLIKQDINFLEYPLWMQDSQQAEKHTEGVLWEDPNGYIYRAGYKPPVRLDLLFLYFFMLKSQENGWAEEVEVSRYEVLKTCELSKGTYWYSRLEESLERWKMIGIKFSGKFFDGKHYITMNFGIIDSWNFKDNGKLFVRFSPEFLTKVKESNFFKLLDFNQLKALRSPLATRLYEILVKSFQGRKRWEIESRKLAQKIPMQEKYPADIIPKIKAAVNRINEETELKLILEIRRPERGKAILSFEKLEEKEEMEKKVALILDVPEEKKESYTELLGLVRVGERGKKSLQSAIQKALSKQDVDYVRRNILYANKEAKKNYRLFLVKALSEDWGEGFEEDEAAKNKARAARQEAAREKRKQEEEEDRTKAVRQQAGELLKLMSPEKQEALRQKALASLPIEEKELDQALFEPVLRMKMIALLAQQFV